MDHKQFKEWLVLSFYGELGDTENELLKTHLDVCKECSAEFSELENLNSILNRSRNKTGRVEDDFLNEARIELKAAIRIEKSKRNFWDSLIESIKDFLSANYKPVISGAAALLLGLGIGYIMFNKSVIAPYTNPIQQEISEEDPFEKSDIKINNLRIISQDEINGEISFAFEAVRPVQVKGNINDANIQKILSYSLLKEENDGVRLRTVSAIAAQQDSSVLLDPKIKSALISAMKSDNNPGVRREALLVLKNYQTDNEIKDALLYVLQNDGNSGLRVAAINSLTKGSLSSDSDIDEKLLNILKEKSKTDENNYIRYRAQTVLQEVVQQ